MGSSSDSKGHAVVVGGSIAGLLAARVLSEHFRWVTLIERDRFPDGPEPRKGIPQARHVHVLLKRGRIILGQLFPGLDNELVALGAPVVDIAADAAWLTPAGWGVRFYSDLDTISFGRDLLDWRIRRRLGICTNVRFLEEHEVTELLANVNGTGIAGVRVSPCNQLNRRSEQLLYADLVVDASGRGSQAPRWLEALGYPRPRETKVHAHLGYASRIYQRLARFECDWKVVFVQTAPPNFMRGGALFPIEGDRWIVTLAGGDSDYPPTDEAGFLEYARSLRTPLLYKAIKDAKPLSPIHRYLATENRRRHYEKLSRMPDNFLVTGDATCAFNPIYGQGMTTAALGAMALDECLREQRRLKTDGNLAGFNRRFQKKLAKVNSAPWMLATGEDLRYRGTEGGRPDFLTRLLHRYMDRVTLLSTKDARVRSVLLEVLGILKPPAALFGPVIALKVLRQAVTQLMVEEEQKPEHKLSEPA